MSRVFVFKYYFSNPGKGIFQWHVIFIDRFRDNREHSDFPETLIRNLCQYIET